MKSGGIDSPLNKGRCKTNVGAGLLANTVCQIHIQRLTLRIREQARSHIEFRLVQTVEFLQEHRHFFFGLFVAMSLGRFNALLPCLPRRSHIT